MMVNNSTKYKSFLSNGVRGVDKVLLSQYLKIVSVPQLSYKRSYENGLTIHIIQSMTDFSKTNSKELSSQVIIVKTLQNECHYKSSYNIAHH